MVSVGVLAALINVAVLILVALADRGIELIVRRFAASRLRRFHRVPVVHDSDTWLPNIPRSIFKFHKNPAILLTLLCSLLLVASELVSEGGVDVSEKCTPTLRNGTVISPGNASNNITPAEIAASAFYLQSVQFYDGELTFVPAGFPRNVTRSVCISCFNRSVDILGYCSVSDDRVYEPGELEVGVVTTERAFSSITRSFRETIVPHKRYDGLGDLTYNGHNYSTFLVHSRIRPDDGIELLYLEYSNGNHCLQLINLARKKSEQNKGKFLNADDEDEANTVWESTQSRVRTQRIFCKVNQMSADKFVSAVRVYRAMQLENTISPAEFIESEERFIVLTEDDINRAVLSMKIIDDEKRDGPYFEYTQCGYYKYIFIAPFLSCLGLILVLGVFTFFTARNNSQLEIPFNSESWFREARRIRGEILSSSAAQQNKRKYFSFVHDEMVLVENDDCEEIRIAWANQQLREAAMFDELGAGAMGSVSTPSSAYTVNP